jgi:histone-lysine N-methyltransferase SUV420H
LHELQGSVVPLPDQWRTEMEIGEGFAVEAAGEESESESEDDDEASVTSSRRDRARTKDADKKQRRSDRTKRRDFSIVWSGLKRCFQLFLGPARFLNVSGPRLEQRARCKVCADSAARLLAKCRTAEAGKIRDVSSDSTGQDRRGVNHVLVSRVRLCLLCVLE